MAGIDTYRMLKLFRRHAVYNNGQLLKYRPENENEAETDGYQDYNADDHRQGIDRIDYEGDY